MTAYVVTAYVVTVLGRDSLDSCSLGRDSLDRDSLGRGSLGRDSPGGKAKGVFGGMSADYTRHHPQPHRTVGKLG